MKKSEVSKVLTILLGAYPNANVTSETVVVYEMLLVDFEATEVLEVVLAHVASSKWFPSVAELRDRIIEKRLALPSSIDVLEQLAAGQFDSFPPSVRTALNICGGIWAYRNSRMPERWRAEFRTVYAEIRDKQKSAAVADSLRALSPGRVVKQLSQGGGR